MDRQFISLVWEALNLNEFNSIVFFKVPKVCVWEFYGKIILSMPMSNRVWLGFSLHENFFCCWNNSSYLAFILCRVACTTRDRQYDVYSTNSICLILIIAAVGVDGNISLEENWNNKHWTKTTGNRQYRSMVTVCTVQITIADSIGWRSIISEAEKCVLYYNVSSWRISLRFGENIIG